VEAGVFLGADGKPRRIVLRLGEERFGNAPELSRADARREASCELRAVDEPFRLRVTAYEGRGKQSHPPKNIISSQLQVGWCITGSAPVTAPKEARHGTQDRRECSS